MQTFPEVILCPYCNQKLQSFTAPDFFSECCGKIVGVTVREQKHVQVFIPPTLPLSCIGNNAANKPIPGVTVRDPNRGRESRWTMIYFGGGGWYVRIVGGFDLEKARLPHGLSMGQVYSTPAEAVAHADLVDRIMETIVENVVKEAAVIVKRTIEEQLS